MNWNDKELVWLHFVEHFLPDPFLDDPATFAEQVIAGLNLAGETAERVRAYYNIKPSAEWRAELLSK